VVAGDEGVGGQSSAAQGDEREGSDAGAGDLAGDGGDFLIGGSGSVPEAWKEAQCGCLGNFGNGAGSTELCSAGALPEQ